MLFFLNKKDKEFYKFLKKKSQKIKNVMIQAFYVYWLNKVQDPIKTYTYQVKICRANSAFSHPQNEKTKHKNQKC